MGNNSSLNKDLRDKIINTMASLEADLSHETSRREWYRDFHTKFSQMTDRELVEYAEGHACGNIDEAFDEDVETAKNEIAFEQAVLGTPVMSREQAIGFLGFMVGRIGGGYHPDNSLDQYIGGTTRKQLFTPEEVAKYQPMHDDMMKVLGDESYLMAIDMFDKILGIS